MKRLIVKGMSVIVLAAALAFPLASPAFASDPHSGGTTGRPNQSCQDLGLTTPGHAANSPGSPFDEPGTNPNFPLGGNGGLHYAGNGPTNSGNGQAAQYDVACFQQSQH